MLLFPYFSWTSPLSFKSRSDEQYHSQAKGQIDLSTSYLISAGLSCKKKVFVGRLHSAHLFPSLQVFVQIIQTD